MFLFHRCGRRILEEGEFVARGIGEDGFEHETFALYHPITAESIGDFRSWRKQKLRRVKILAVVAMHLVTE